MTTHEPTQGLLLNGLDGGNPLGFLAAVGALRVATQAEPAAQWRLAWKIHGGAWAPRMTTNDAITSGTFMDTLTLAFEGMTDNPAFEFGKNLTVDPETFKAEAEAAQNVAILQDRRYADFIAAFGCESLTISNGKTIQDTALRTMSGAGHQHFLGSMKELVEKTNPDHLQAALFEQWQYSDGRPSLRWDPVDDRRYALRWMNPGNTSKSPIRTMRGANRLAIEALPLLPTAPGEKDLHTTGFSQRQGEGVFFTWPIWDNPLSVDVVRSLLSRSELQDPQPDRASLIPLGVVEVYRSQRITADRYRNFTPALPA